MKKKRGMIFVPYDYEAAFAKSIEDIHEYFVEQMLKHRYKCVYALKEIIAGEQLEIEVYPEFKSMDEVPEAGRVKRDNSKAQKNLNDKNSRKYVERLLNENFGNEDIWVTLTYSDGEEPKDMDKAVKNMQNYIRRIAYQRKKRGLPPAKYIYITEHNPDADIRWHHHLVMDGLLDMDTVEAAWKKGRRNETRRLDKDEYGLTGMSHYITKEKNRKKGEKRWNSSQNLKQFRVRKVHSKPTVAAGGRYKPIGTFVDGFVKDAANIRQQAEQWYPDYDFTDSGVYYNDFNGMFYIRARMRRKEKNERKRQSDVHGSISRGSGNGNSRNHHRQQDGKGDGAKLGKTVGNFGDHRGGCSGKR